MVRWYRVHFQCRGVLLICIIVGQWPLALAVGAGGGCLDIFSLVYHFSFRSPSLWETARYQLKYCLKGPLSHKSTNQPTSRGFAMLAKVEHSIQNSIFHNFYIPRLCRACVGRAFHGIQNFINIEGIQLG